MLDKLYSANQTENSRHVIGKHCLDERILMLDFDFDFTHVNSRSVNSLSLGFEIVKRQVMLEMPRLYWH